MTDNYVPRLSFEITEEQQKRLMNALPIYGTKRAIFSIILDDLLDLIDEKGQIVIGVILDHALKPREMLPSLAKVEDK